MNYAAIKPVDVANGPGIRVSLFVCGCTHHCKGCFNKETWDFHYGSRFDEEIEQQILKLLDHSYITGLSLLGGEPLEPENQSALLSLLQKVHKQFPEKTIWCYSGYQLEYIMSRMMPGSSKTSELMGYLDVLVDGMFIEDEKDLNLRFRGSRNQRILDVQASLRTGSAVWHSGYS
ncbi:MAG: anaerobic ribonucleoside-triphosphate reductase activating protein [Lachnospiraceae bacterium]